MKTDTCSKLVTFMRGQFSEFLQEH